MQTENRQKETTGAQAPQAPSSPTNEQLAALAKGGDRQARRAWMNRYRQAIKRENALCDRIDKTAAPPVEWREQLALLVVQGLTVRREIEQAIEALPDALQVCVLRYRFLACMTSKQTAKALGYTARQIKRIQAAGLDALTVPEVQE